ncbi:hypothetical protein MCOR02_011268 [Pyricularia oryzae]|uniref:Major facilitator superfamily (MFS) profile domain-containing protein n=1 Tax=Pyricularia oryzae TaxID=318829 RepID=A0A4P7NCT8_PYROR|nr:hypothetical protein MCOR02_011268 [Pyricularia oryzae]KAI6290064.1 hypothetical protein MCOR34_010538 [Pyricularia oryzae]KAI6450030.1 hypothetical protein MCOR17_010025 [Pyricularia oryzae]KAI6479771.1 hypothetical protein MCOR13_011345 [Pyricularia oryzae]KAI6555731.1 hypothetical protein MCOR04_010387 [Pyricularia oryzae]
MSSSKTDPPLRVLTPRLAESRPNSPSSVDRKTGSAETVDTVSHEGPPSSHGRGAAFWVVFASLSLMALLSAMEGGIMSTALPSISRAVNAEGNYVWIVNVYVLASAAVQPLYGQVADLWGTRWPMLSSITIFATGSAMCGAANDIATLIGGRTIQGFGVAGINILAEVILSDLLPMRLRDRDQFMGFIFLFTVLGSLLGPFLGGIIIGGASWRWIFLLNLPFCGFCLGLLFISLKPAKARSNDDRTPLQKVKSIKYDVGIILLCASVTSVLYVMAYGGSGAKYPWSHPIIITALVLGLLGHVLFIAFEVSPWCHNPVLPMPQNRTSIAAYVLEVLQTLVSCGTLYFLPLCFQSTLAVSPQTSGVLLLPFSISFCISPALGGGLANNSGSFRSLHVISFILMTITMGIFTLLGHDTPLSATAIIGIMAGISVGLPSASILAVIRTALPNSLETANSAFALIRSISTAFAFSIPAAVFNNRFDQLLAASTLDSSVRENLQLGKAYQQASSDIFNTQAEVVGIYELSLKLVWQVLIGVAAVGIAASLVEKNLEFHPDAATDEEFGLEESKGRPSIESEVRMSGMNT